MTKMGALNQSRVNYANKRGDSPTCLTLPHPQILLTVFQIVTNDVPSL